MGFARFLEESTTALTVMPAHKSRAAAAAAAKRTIFFLFADFALEAADENIPLILADTAEPLPDVPTDGVETFFAPSLTASNTAVSEAFRAPFDAAGETAALFARCLEATARECETGILSAAPER